MKRTTLVAALIGAAVAAWGTKLVLFGNEVATLDNVTVNCPKNHGEGECHFDVIVKVSGLLGCTANSPYNVIEVNTAFKDKKMRWKIKVDDPRDRSRYRFKSDGISLNPSSKNEPDKDLYNPGFDDNDKHPKAYKWHNRNLQAKKIYFDPKVERCSTESESEYCWIDCTPIDPLIRNAG